MIYEKKRYKDNISWSWDDDGLLGDFYFICPNCQFKNEDITDCYSLDNAEILTCKKCEHKFIVKRETCLEEATDNCDNG